MQSLPCLQQPFQVKGLVSLNPMNEIRLYMILDLNTVYTRYIKYNVTNIFLDTAKAEIYIGD